MDAINAALDKLYQDEHLEGVAQIRRDQTGTGMRSDKIRTYRFQDDQVQDHQTGKTTRAKKVMAGHMDKLWSA